MGVPEQGLSALLQCKCPLGVALLALCASFVCALLSLCAIFPRTERGPGAFSSLQGVQKLTLEFGP